VDDNLLPRKSSTLLLHNYFEFPDPSQECCEVGVVWCAWRRRRRPSHLWPSPFTLKSIYIKAKKKNYGNSKIISPCKNLIFKKNLIKKKKGASKRNQNPLKML
jgi:hypothetical protein